MERLTSPLPFLEAIESLKNLKRTGWCKRDVRNPESVSDHMYQMVWFCLAHPEVSSLLTSRGSRFAESYVAERRGRDGGGYDVFDS